MVQTDPKKKFRTLLPKIYLCRATFWSWYI